MRDILICKKCEFFKENQIDPVMMVKVNLDSSLMEIGKKYFFRRHNCEFECLSTRIGRLKNRTEYYNLEIPPECSYRLEHEMYGMNGEHGVVDYSMRRHFRTTRTCQHCGSVIPNKKRCPNCGYDYFETYKPYSECAIVAQVALLIMLGVLVLVVSLR